jgi:hypothetical protein
MVMFGRRKPPTPEERPDEQRDEAFPYFTSRQAARFREVARQGFAEAGLEVTMYADHVIDSSGRVFGLANVAAICRQAEHGEPDWREITSDHARRTVRSMDEPSPFETMSHEQLLAATYLRILATADLGQVDASYARPVTDGISEVLNLDLPETVATFLDVHVESLGPLEDLRRAGLANLRRVRVDGHQLFEHQGGRIEILLGESMFTASTLLILDDVLARQGITDGGVNGVLVAAPYRHQLAFHVIRDLSALPSLGLLASFAHTGFSQAPGPVSPHVYWWRHGSLRRLTEHGPQGIGIRVDEELAEVMESLA